MIRKGDSRASYPRVRWKRPPGYLRGREMDRDGHSGESRKSKGTHLIHDELRIAKDPMGNALSRAA
jgi:hypothetical protein